MLFFNSVLVIFQWLVHLSMLSWSSFNQYSPQYSFLWNTLTEKKKMLVTSISSFSQTVFNSGQDNFSFALIFIMSSVTAFNLDYVKKNSFGKELSELCHLQKLSIWKSLKFLSSATS